MTEIIEQHIPCPDCGSSDALCKYEDGHSYCFSCLTYTPPEGRDDRVFTYEYLPHRGITSETFRFYDAKTKIDPEGRPLSIGFKYPNESYKVRRLNVPKTETFYSIGDIGKAGLYGRERFNGFGKKTITITEGELDALSLYQVLRSPVVSVKSASTAGTDAGMERSWLNEYERIYLAFDGDEAGRRAAQAVAKLFDPNKIYDIRFPGGTRK